MTSIFAHYFGRLAPVALIILGTVICKPALAQSPTSFAVSPSTIYKAPATSSCYTISVGNGANMTVDTRYRLNSGAEQTLIGWPALNSSGQAYICTDAQTETGIYTFTGVRRTGSGEPFLNINVPLTVLPTPPQPTTLTFNGSANSSGYAGNSSYTLHADNLPNGLLDLDYMVIATPGQPPVASGTATIPLNAAGNWFYTLSHYETIGEWRFSRMKNSLRSDWVPISASYTIRPPHPTSAVISPSAVVAGQGAYTMAVGNGANVTLDVRYTLDTGNGEVSAPDIFGWPFLPPAAPNSPDGNAVIQVGPCTQLGTYRIKFIENTLNRGLWQIVNAATGFVTVTAPPPPTTATRSPSAAKVGASGNLTINGSNLCGVTLTTTYPGLSFGAIPDVYSSTGTTVATTFNIAPNAQSGTAIVTLNARGGSTTFPFYVSSTLPPTLTEITPPSASAGGVVNAVLAGTNLIGGTLASSVSGITFDNISYNASGASMNARFIVAAGTPPGTSTITVTTPSGSASKAFVITAGGSGPITSSREYIRLGDRLLAVETASSQPAPPTAPSPLTATVVNMNTVDLAWHASTAAPGMSLTYEVWRGGVLIETMTQASAAPSYRDHNANQHTTYTYTVVARDSFLQGSSSNSVTVTTPWEALPPSAPLNLDMPVWGDTWSVLTWSPSTDTGGSGLAGYYVAFPGDSPFSGLIPASETSLVIDYTQWPDINWEWFYGFYVYAVDHAGNLSPPGRWP
jgi:hypothetical protein